MKLYLLMILVCCSISGYSQNRDAGAFSVTDHSLLHEITESPDLDLSRVVLSGDEETETKVVTVTAELYYNEFLRAVNDLRNAVEYKRDFLELQKKHPFLEQDALRMLGEITWLKAYGSGTYGGLFSQVNQRYTMLQDKFRDPEVPVYDDFPYKRAESPAVYKARMEATSALIMKNLNTPAHLISNKKLAEEGRRFYQELMKRP
ncbi:MAG: hypothetical protein K0M63_05550 [Weeksellaceae bacterium]|nr:hypothetical protein [Weeksellaceae bacterium]